MMRKHYEYINNYIYWVLIPSRALFYELFPLNLTCELDTVIILILMVYYSEGFWQTLF